MYDVQWQALGATSQWSIVARAVKVGQLGSPGLAHHGSWARTSYIGWLTFLMSHKNTNSAQPT